MPVEEAEEGVKRSSGRPGGGGEHREKQGQLLKQAASTGS